MQFYGKWHYASYYSRTIIFSINTNNKYFIATLLLLYMYLHVNRPSSTISSIHMQYNDMKYKYQLHRYQRYSILILPARFHQPSQQLIRSLFSWIIDRGMHRKLLRIGRELYIQEPRGRVDCSSQNFHSHLDRFEHRL